MLANRTVKFRTDESKITIKPVKGCPQGGCLSPLLWCLVVDSLINELESKGCHVTAYADDLALVVQGETAKKTCSWLRVHQFSTIFIILFILLHVFLAVSPCTTSARSSA